MTREQQVGQLFMTAVTDTEPGADLESLVRRHHVGSVLFLGAGPWTATGTAAASRTISAWGDDAPVLLAADQEGGRIQRLRGAGFSRIPSATVQGRMTPAALQSAWTGWGGQLRTAGVRFDLAPVADVVPAGMDAANDPVGAMDRNLGTTRAHVAVESAAVVRGLTAAGVASSVKHYPGLGRTDVNTDYGVAHDTRTTEADVEDYRAAMDAGASSVMVSSSTYERIDPGVPAMFSSRIVTGLLRTRQGWDKAVVSDDLDANALASVPVRDRALRFLRAGGDLAVDTNPATLGRMVDAVLDAADEDPAFAATLPVHAARVLELKQQVGLVRCA